MLSLVWRQVRKTATIQIALAVLFASAITVFLIYSSYIANENMLAGVRVVERIPAGHFLVETATLEAAAAPLPLVGSWQQASLGSNVGELPCVLIGSDSPFSIIAPAGTVIVHQSMAHRLGLEAGSQVTLYHNGRPVNMQVFQVYNDSSLTKGYDFGDKALVFTGAVQKSSHHLYRNNSSNVQWGINTLARFHPNATITDSTSDVSLGAIVAKSTAAVASQSKMSLVFFVAVAFLTAKVLGFMDNRRILAILKAIGLKHGEVARFMFFDAIVSPLAGAVAGAIIGRYVLAWFESRGTGLSFTTAILVQSLMALLPAIAVGVYVPARFAKMASVNELALERNVSLFYEKVDSLRRRLPGLDPYIARGIHFIKLDMVDGVFDGYVFRRLGDNVRKGEVLASDTSWWGLKSREYLAPTSGVVVFYEPDSGVIGVGPAETLELVPSIRRTRLSFASAGQSD